MHVKLLARCVVGDSAASAASNARKEVVLRASRLIESIILTRPSEDNRTADDGWNGKTAPAASLRPKHRSAHLPERDSAHSQLWATSHKRSNVSGVWILENGGHHRSRPLWNRHRVAKRACYCVQHVERRTGKSGPDKRNKPPANPWLRRKYKVARVTPVNCTSRKVERADRRLRATDPLLVLHGVDGVSNNHWRGISGGRRGRCPRQRKRLRVNERARIARVPGIMLIVWPIVRYDRSCEQDCCSDHDYLKPNQPAHTG